MSPDLRLKSITFTCKNNPYIDSVQLTYSDGSVSPLFKTTSNRYQNRMEVRVDTATPVRRVSNYQGGYTQCMFKFYDAQG